MSSEVKVDSNDRGKNDYSPIGEKIKEYGWGYRHMQSFLIFTIVTTLYIVRTSMSVSVIALTDISRNDTDWETYDWDKQTQDYILSSFFWGYMSMQIPAGQLAQRFGGKILLVCSVLINGLIYVVLPFIIRLGGWKAAFVFRVLQGMTQSCMMPSVYTILGKWVPVNERSRLGNFIIAGVSFGTIIGLPLSGLISEHFGWHITFHAIGAFAIVMGFLLIWLGYDSPADHPSISHEEKFYIQSSLGQITNPKRLKNPWKSIITSIPAWALLCTQTGSAWTLIILLLEIPSYMKMVLRINMQQSGLYSALPFIAMWSFGLIFSIISDALINRKIFSIAITRKIFNCIGTFGTSLALIVLSYIPSSNVSLSLIVLTLATGLLSGTNVGLMLNHIDLSPNFAGLLMAITNSLANAVSVFAPISVGMILEDTSDSSQWRKVFFLMASISSLTNIVFLIFGSVQKQPWNEPDFDGDVEMIHEKKANGSNDLTNK